MRTGLEPVTPCVTGMYSNQTELTHQIRQIIPLLRGLLPFAVAKVGPFLRMTKLSYKKMLAERPKTQKKCILALFWT